MLLLELIKNFINLETYCAQLLNFIDDLYFLKLSFLFKLYKISHIISSCSDIYQLLTTQHQYLFPLTH